jgi:dTDP-6-deoxy-L-talose 4-dehydrogenase (NAD+)
VLLTGGTGFVGRQVLRALHRAGVQVRAVVRQGSAGRLPEPVADVIESPDLFAEHSAWWTEAAATVDAVVHVAWYAEPGAYLTSPLNLSCLTGTLQLADGALRAGVRRFVGVGTCLEYDLRVGHLANTTPLDPVTPYAAAKAAAYLALSRHYEQVSASFAWCRLFHLYGEAEDSRRLVPYVREQLAAGRPAELTAGTQLRDFLDVAIAGRMIAEVALSDRTGAVNICSGEAMTVRALAERIADEYRRRDLLHFGAKPNRPGEPTVIVGVPS